MTVAEELEAIIEAVMPEITKNRVGDQHNRPIYLVFQPGTEKPGKLAVIDQDQPTPTGWQLATPERIPIAGPYCMTIAGVKEWVRIVTRRLPILSTT